MLRYYESTKKTREEKVIDTLETMGASILVGGLSTALGVLPLSLSTSNIMGTVFICFFAMIALGVTYGLVFLPVILSICGPTSVGIDVVSGTGDLTLKHNSASDTDQSDDDSDKAMVSGKPRVAKHNTSSASNMIATSDSSHDEVVHSSRTFREESLEVVHWSDTMAWI